MPSVPVASVVAAEVPALLAVGDPGRTRTVLAAIAFLVAIGVGLLVLAGWLIRATRVDPEVLAPLEVMGERSWRRGDPVWQRRRLDEVRPAGAEPLVPMAPVPDTDAEFDRGPQLGDFHDFDDLLRELGVDLDAAAPSAVGGADMGPPPEDLAVIDVVETETGTGTGTGTDTGTGTGTGTGTDRDTVTDDDPTRPV